MKNGKSNYTLKWNIDFENSYYYYYEINSEMKQRSNWSSGNWFSCRKSGFEHGTSTIVECYSYIRHIVDSLYIYSITCEDFPPLQQFPAPSNATFIRVSEICTILKVIIILTVFMLPGEITVGEIWLFSVYIFVLIY